MLLVNHVIYVSEYIFQPLQSSQSNVVLISNGGRYGDGAYIYSDLIGRNRYMVFNQSRSTYTVIFAWFSHHL